MPQMKKPRLQSPAQAERRDPTGPLSALRQAESIGPDPTFGSGLSPEQMTLLQDMAMMGVAGGTRPALNDILKTLIKLETRAPSAPRSSLLSALRGAQRGLPKKPDEEVEQLFNTLVNDPQVQQRLFRK